VEQEGEKPQSAHPDTPASENAKIQKDGDTTSSPSPDSQEGFVNNPFSDLK
jgi:hypothetical protein